MPGANAPDFQNRKKKGSKNIAWKDFIITISGLAKKLQLNNCD
jgi:hypothetical protein